MAVTKTAKQKRPAKQTEIRVEWGKSSNALVRIGVIGFGYWGPNLLRNFQDLDRSKVVAVADLQGSALTPLAKRYPAIRLTTAHQEILKDKTVDAVVIATPVSTHFELAKTALQAGKHVLVEKPLAASSGEGRALIDLARQKKRILMVGHTFEYNPAVLKVAELLKSQELGELYYIDSIRVNLGRYQSDGRNVIWDLAPHDLSIILHWMGKMPAGISAFGQSYLQKGTEDVAFIRMEFPGGILAHVHLSWLAPAKIRRMTVVGSKKMVLYDDLDNSEKLKIADRGAHLDANSTEIRVDYRMGDVVSPHLDFKEPLKTECEHFLESILQNRTPRTDGENGNRVVKILEAADQSMREGGRVISL